MLRANRRRVVFKKVAVEIQGVKFIGQGDNAFVDSFSSTRVFRYYFTGSMSRSKSKNRKYNNSYYQPFFHVSLSYSLLI